MNSTEHKPQKMQSLAFIQLIQSWPTSNLTSLSTVYAETIHPNCQGTEPSLDPLQWRHNGRDSVSNHEPHDCLHNCLFRRGWKKTPKLRVTGLCARSSPRTGEFPAQMASYAENVCIWWRHHVNRNLVYTPLLWKKISFWQHKKTQGAPCTNMV